MLIFIWALLGFFFLAINGMMPALQARHEQEYQAFLQK